MAEQELKKCLQQLMQSVDGLHAIIITDRDGVPVLKVSDPHAPELAMRPRFLATTGMAMDQAGKLGVGQNKNIVAMYTNHQVVYLHTSPLVITMVASSEANTGALLGLEEEMQTAIQDIKVAVDIS